MVDYGRRPGSRRRWSLILLAILMHGVAPRIATAQEDHEHEEPSETHHRGLHFSHPLFTESVTPDTKVRLDFGRVWEDEENESELEFEAEYGLHRSFSILALIRYVFLDAEAEPSVSSLGSVEIALKFANFAFEEAGVLLGYGIGVGLPTGDDEVVGGSGHLWELEPFLNIGFKHGRLELVGFTIFGIPVNQAEGEEVETELKYDVSTLYHITPRIQGLVELNGGVVLSGEEAGAGLVVISPGIKVAPLPTRALFIGIGGSIPLSDGGPNGQLKISAFYHF